MMELDTTQGIGPLIEDTADHPFWNAPTLPVKLSRSNARLPTRGSADAVGLDLYACVEGRVNGIPIYAGCRKTIPIGISVAVPHGYYGRIAPRSGLAFKHGLDVLAGVIDPDYRGELFVILQNHGEDIYWVQDGERVAQLILERCDLYAPVQVDDLPPTARGDGRFGSTGT